MKYISIVEKNQNTFQDKVNKVLQNVYYVQKFDTQMVLESSHSNTNA